MSNTPYPKTNSPLALANIARGLIGIGLLVLVLGWVVAPERMWSNVLLVSTFLLGIGLGAGFLLAGLHLTGAKWDRGLTCLPERLWVFLPIGGIGILMVLALGTSIYPWSHPEGDMVHILDPHKFKGWWLQHWFVVLRAVFFLGLYIVLLRGAVLARRTGSVHTGRFMAGFVVALMLTVWMAVSDWVMSLEPAWFSTMFGFYCFAGFFSSAIATVTLVGLAFKKYGLMKNAFSEAQLHDLGKLQFAFSTFWMYVWFSQYMLIWYTDNPEETSYFINRIDSAWGALFVANLFLNWIVPFFALLSARAKRSVSIMTQVAIVVLVGHWLDLYMMIVPSVEKEGGFAFGVYEIGIGLGGVGLFLFIFLRIRSALANEPEATTVMAPAAH